MSKKAKLYLIPNLLGDATTTAVIPSDVQQIIQGIDHYLVEREREARRYLIKLGIQKPIDDLHFSILDKRSSPQEMDELLAPALAGNAMGIISDAGCPGIADPGALAVAAAHRHAIPVVPLVGPSSILLALIASGLNGQSFAFHGYLPRETSDRVKSLKKLENNLYQNGQTQIFMETPYRNDQMIKEVIRQLRGETKFCIACDLSLKTEWIKTKSIREWKGSHPPSLHKRPAIFLIGQ